MSTDRSWLRSLRRLRPSRWRRLRDAWGPQRQEGVERGSAAVAPVRESLGLPASLLSHAMPCVLDQAQQRRPCSEDPAPTAVEDDLRGGPPPRFPHLRATHAM